MPFTWTRRTPASHLRTARTALGVEALETRDTPAAPVVTNLRFVAPGTLAPVTSVTEGAAVRFLGDVADPTPGDGFTVAINWGDGSAVQTLTLPAGSTGFAVDHVYVDDNPTGTPSDVYAPSVTVTDTNGTAGTGANLITNGGFETGNLTGWTPGGTSTVSGVATDGTVIPGTAPQFGTTYVQPRSGTYAAYTHISALNGVYLTLTQTVTLPAGTYTTGYYVTVDSPGAPAGYSAGSSEVVVNGQSVSLTGGTFVVIPGDGTFVRLAGTFTTTGGPVTLAYTVTGSGLGIAGASVDDVFLTALTPSASVTVVNSDPVLTTIGGQQIAEGQALSVGGSFTDAGSGPTETWTAEVDYGDGSGFQPLALTGQSFAPAHTYAADGSYTVTVRVRDDDMVAGTYATTSFVVTVDPGPPAVTALSASAGPLAGGAVVTITGTNFTGATAVSFGGTPAASFTVVSDTQITVVVPARTAGAVDVTVTAPGGTSAATAADRFTYVAPPVATIGRPSVPRVTAGQGAVSFLITYSSLPPGAVTLTARDVVLSRTGTANGVVTVVRVNATTFRVTVSRITGSGPLGIALKAGTAVDPYGQSAPAAGPSVRFAVAPPPPFRGLQLSATRR